MSSNSHLPSPWRGCELRLMRTGVHPRITQEAMRKELKWDRSKVVWIETERLIPTPSECNQWIVAIERILERRKALPSGPIIP